MKNVFKKTVALVSAMSLMAVGTAVSVSASAEKIELEVKSSNCELAAEQIAGYNTYEVQPGASIKADLTFVNSASKQFDTINLRTDIGDLTFEKALPKGKLAQAAPDGSFVQYIESFGDPYVVEEDEEVIVTFQLTVPADAKPGDQFKVEWSPVGDYSFAIADSTSGSKENLPYSMVPAVFVVPGAVTTTEAPITTTEAPITTTEAPITTTEAPATTVAATTVTTAGTTVSVSKAPSSPATGSSSNGVAALAVTMVAAAGAAIALKKKND